jgi:16S rRNA A1518/A1519 N6-dimethyltransferase RsmA/KsgA/DIM1 with predicted DNA glycosylase/AP lyase activity
MQHHLQQLLDQHTKMKVIFEDVLEVESDKLQVASKEQTLVVGNLPYYITSPILRKFF